MNHYLVTRLSLEKESAFQKTVPAESLEHFLESEQEGVARVLQNSDSWAQEHYSFYSELHRSMQFSPQTEYDDPVHAFQLALRINPEYRFDLYRIRLEDNADDFKRTKGPSLFNVMPPSMMSDTYTSYFYATKPIAYLNEGEPVAIWEVLSTATEEPDLGMDVGCFENNGTPWGKHYGFGPQPWGDIQVITGSQAPFHMSFQHEAPLVYRVSLLKVSYLPIRSHVYFELSQYAFAHQHPYWGFRFLGMALHYAQDSAQPYHTRGLPNIPLWKVVGAYSADLLDLHQYQRDLIDGVANKHWSLENYVDDHLQYCRRNPHPSVLIAALQDTSEDAVFADLEWNTLLDRINDRSASYADDLDDTLQKEFPAHCSDPHYLFTYKDAQENLLCEFSEDPLSPHRQTNRILQPLLRMTGAVTRKAAYRGLLAPTQKKG